MSQRRLFPASEPAGHSGEDPNRPERMYWVGFSLVKGIGAVRFRSLLDWFGSAAEAWGRPAEELEAAGLSARLAAAVVEARESGALEKTWEAIDRQGIQVVIATDGDYPPGLKSIAQPPPVLYARGEIKTQDELAVAIVGTRRVTSYGRQAAEEIAAGLAGQGVTVVSGLARGVDAAAHSTALRCNGRTFAVLGSGVDRIYPPEHTRMAEEIAAHGAVLSDYPPGTPPEAANFPPRNRIISGLARAVVVIEAGQKSGALITATFAEEQNRPVIALPGNIYAPLSKGTNWLISRGARILLGVQDVLDVLNLEKASKQIQARLALPADALEAQILSLMGAEPQHVDELRALTGLPVEQIAATLAMMELKGMVRGTGGMSYLALREAGADYE